MARPCKREHGSAQVHALVAHQSKVCHFGQDVLWRKLLRKAELDTGIIVAVQHAQQVREIGQALACTRAAFLHAALHCRPSHVALMRLQHG